METRRSPWILILAFSLAFVLLAPTLALIIAWEHYASDLPSVESLKNYRPKTVSYFYSDDGRVIGEFSHEYRLVVPLTHIPGRVINAFLAAEDANFYSHPGVDLAGIARAFIKNTVEGRIVQGASTITMQVTRSFLLSPEKTYDRKIREAILSYRLEQKFSKEEILYLYLNQIYLGHGAYGVEAAARTYFGKHASQLNLAEAAMIAGLAKAPSNYSPYYRMDLVKGRQKYVLKQMAEAGFITPDQHLEALEAPLNLYERTTPNMKAAPYFTEHVRLALEEMFGPDRVYDDGLKVYTTVNLDLQAAARASLARGLADHSKRQGYSGPVRHLEDGESAGFQSEIPADPEDPFEALVLEADRKGLTVRAAGTTGMIPAKDLKWALKRGSITNTFSPGDVILVSLVENGLKDKSLFSLEDKAKAQGALLCLENTTGRIKAMIGGRDFRESQFNRAVQALRQPGSSFKPFVYTTAIDAGFTPADIVWDEYIEYNDHGRVWAPQNYDRKFLGPVTLYEALARSRNVVAVRLLEKVGIQAVISQARKMGLTSNLAPYLSLALGSSEVSLVEMASAYAVFPNQGLWTKPLFITRIEDRDGRVIARFTPRWQQAVAPETAYVILDMLKGVVQRGTATRLKALKRPVAGKTGTTNDLADAWFIGFTPEYTSGVWIGHDQRQRLGRRETGGTTAAPVFLSFMQKALAGRPPTDFPAPLGVTFARIDPDTGYLAEEWTERPFRVCFKSDQVGPSSHSEFLSAQSTWETNVSGAVTPDQLIHIGGRTYRMFEPYRPEVLTEETPVVRPDIRAVPLQPLNQGEFILREETIE